MIQCVFEGGTLTVCQSGWGVFPRQKLLSVHVAFLSMLSLRLSPRRLMSGRRAPAWRTKSRQGGLSPAMFPSAQTACSRTSGSWLLRSSTKIGTAPASMTTCVCWAEPEAMLVSAHAASNWTRVCGDRRNSTNRLTTPVSMTRSIGGLRSLDRSFRNLVVAWICSSICSEKTPLTICGSSSFNCHMR